jgi:hypothetical protein
MKQRNEQQQQSQQQGANRDRSMDKGMEQGDMNRSDAGRGDIEEGMSSDADVMNR